MIASTDKESTMTSAQMVTQLIQEMSRKNEYAFVECTYRNMVLIGRTRTGKSTISDTLQDPFHLPSLPVLFAGTRRIAFNRITTTHQGNSYFFTIIDSPGLYDVVQKEGERLTNATIKTHLDECITKDITHIHAFAFVVSRSSSGINIQDIQSMVFIQSNYPQLQNFLMLIITHCEEDDASERNKFLEEFFQHPDIIRHRLQGFFGLGVHFMGCLRPQLKRVPNMTAARNQASNILEMRKELLDFLVARQETYNIHRSSEANSSVNKIRRAFSHRLIIIAVILAVLTIIFGH
jgi:GTP-binding protein EngB required for normal cell division